MGNHRQHYQPSNTQLQKEIIDEQLRNNRNITPTFRSGQPISRSCTCLLYTSLSAIEDKAVLQSTRAAAPIWIPGLPIHQRDLSTMAVACPECLRPFSHSPRDEAFVEQESDCPHCLRSVRLAIVRPSEEMDKTCLLYTSGTICQERAC